VEILEKRLHSASGEVGWDERCTCFVHLGVRRWLLGGVLSNIASLPNSQLAMVPGTTRVTLVVRTDWQLSIFGGFLDSSIPEAE
jgi:hypothetical protein